MRSIYRKTTALLTALLFCATQLGISPESLAAVPRSLATEVQVTVPSFQISIPPELGQIKNLNTSQGPVLVHIQSAHGNYGAQKNIEAILHHLNNEYGIQTLFVEGSPYPLKPERIRFFPEDMPRTREVANQLAKRALLKGAELYLLDEPEVEAYGIEDLEAYRKNVEAFREVMSQRDVLQKQLKTMRREMQSKASRHLSREAREFLKSYDKFDAGEFELSDWLAILKKKAKNHLDLDLQSPTLQLDWPMLVRMYTLQNLEAKLNLKKYQKEKKKFYAAIRAMIDPRFRGDDKSIAPSDDIALSSLRRQGSIVDQIKAYLDQPLSTHELPNPETSQLFEHLVATLPANFQFNRYPNVQRFIAHLMLQSEVKATQLYEEIETMSEQISQSFATTEEAKEVLKEYKRNRLLKKLFNLELTPRDYEALLHVIPAKAGICSDKTQEIPAFAGMTCLDDTVNKALNFYQWAKKRDDLMIQNLENKINKLGIQKAVVITGGFHAKPFEDHFTEKGFSYALITPKMKDLKGKEAYIESIMTSSLRGAPKARRGNLTTSSLESIFQALSRSEIRSAGFDPTHFEKILAEDFGISRSESRAKTDHVSDIQKFYGGGVASPEAIEEWVTETLLPQAGKKLIAEVKRLLEEVHEMPDEVEFNRFDQALDESFELRQALLQTETKREIREWVQKARRAVAPPVPVREVRPFQSWLKSLREVMPDAPKYRQGKLAKRLKQKALWSLHSLEATAEVLQSYESQFGWRHGLLIMADWLKDNEKITLQEKVYRIWLKVVTELMEMEWKLSGLPEGSEIRKLLEEGIQDQLQENWDANNGNLSQPFLGRVMYLSDLFELLEQRLQLAGKPVAWVKSKKTKKGLNKKRIEALSFSSDGDKLISTGDDGKLDVWDAESREHLKRLKGHKGKTVSLVSNSDGKKLLSAGKQDGAIYRWDLTNWEHENALEGKRPPSTYGLLPKGIAHSWGVSYVTLSPDEKKVLTLGTGSRGTVRVWDAQTGDFLFHLFTEKKENYSSGIVSAAFSMDSQRIITMDVGRDTEVWSANTGGFLFEIPSSSPHTKYAFSFVAMTPDGKKLIRKHSMGPVQILEWNDSEDAEHLLDLPLSGTEGEQTAFYGNGSSNNTDHSQYEFKAFALSLDGKRFVASDETQHVRVWDIQTGDLLISFQPKSAVTSLAISPDGSQIVTGDSKGRIQSWNLVWDSGITEEPQQASRSESRLEVDRLDQFEVVLEAVIQDSSHTGKVTLSQQEINRYLRESDRALGLFNGEHRESWNQAFKLVLNGKRLRKDDPLLNLRKTAQSSSELEQRGITSIEVISNSKKEHNADSFAGKVLIEMHQILTKLLRARKNSKVPYRPQRFARDRLMFFPVNMKGDIILDLSQLNDWAREPNHVAFETAFLLKLNQAFERFFAEKPPPKMTPALEHIRGLAKELRDSRLNITLITVAPKSDKKRLNGDRKANPYSHNHWRVLQEAHDLISKYKGKRVRLTVAERLGKTNGPEDILGGTLVGVISEVEWIARENEVATDLVVHFSSLVGSNLQGL